MMNTYRAAPDVDVVTSTATIAGFGNLAINAFVIHASEPVLVDSGAVRDSEDFMTALRSVIDPAELRWIWLTHTDFDHIGSLHRLLHENERLRVITSFLGVGIMSLAAPLPMDRVYLVNPGQTVDLGDRTLTALRPPAFDNPITTGLKRRAFGKSSSVRTASEPCWTKCRNAPRTCPTRHYCGARSSGPPWYSSWLHHVDRAVFASELNRIRALEPTMVLSSHLPAAQGSSLERLLGALSQVPDAPAFVGPDQAALEQMLASVTGGAA